MAFWRFLYQWGGRLVMAAAFLIGIPDSFSATKDLVAWAKPYGMQPIHLAFLLLGIGAIYTTITQGLRNKSLESKRPQIQVKHEVHNNRAILEVKNLGGNASFTARAKVVDKVLQPDPYYMCWDSITGIECPINKDGDASILVGSLTDEFKGYGGKPEREVVLFKVGESGKEKLYLSSPQVSEQLKLRKRYPTMPTQIPEEKCTIEISITSKPSPIKAFKPQRYLFKIDHNNEDRLIFTSELNPD